MSTKYHDGELTATWLINAAEKMPYYTDSYIRYAQFMVNEMLEFKTTIIDVLKMAWDMGDAMPLEIVHATIGPDDDNRDYKYHALRKNIFKQGQELTTQYMRTLHTEVIKDMFNNISTEFLSTAGMAGLYRVITDCFYTHPAWIVEEINHLETGLYLLLRDTENPNDEHIFKKVKHYLFTQPIQHTTTRKAA